MKFCAMLRDATPTLTDNLRILAGIQPGGIRHLKATLLSAKYNILDLEDLLHDPLVRPLDERQERLKYRCPFVPVAWKVLNNASN